jgi:hypothetical protein
MLLLTSPARETKEQAAAVSYANHEHKIMAITPYA